MSKIDDDILNPDPDSLAVEADEDAQYEPNTDSSVVVVEPDIITIGRKRRKDAMSDMQ